MKISKKRAIALAILEARIRADAGGYTEGSDKDIIDSLGDDWKPWRDYAPSMIATMLYDRVFPFQFYTASAADINKFKRKFGKRLWDAAIVSYLTGDHDT